MRRKFLVWLDLVELLLAIDDGRYTIKELEDAATTALRSGCVTRALIEQRVLVDRVCCAEEVTELDALECGTLAQPRFAIDSPEMYDDLVRTHAGREVG